MTGLPLRNGGRFEIRQNGPLFKPYAFALQRKTDFRFAEKIKNAGTHLPQFKRTQYRLRIKRDRRFCRFNKTGSSCLHDSHSGRAFRRQEEYEKHRGQYVLTREFVEEKNPARLSPASASAHLGNCPRHRRFAGSNVFLNKWQTGCRKNGATCADFRKASLNYSVSIGRRRDLPIAKSSMNGSCSGSGPSAKPRYHPGSDSDEEFS